jgi:hypothetical protein
VGNSPSGFLSGGDHRKEAHDIGRLALNFDIIGGEFQGLDDGGNWQN